MYTGAQRKQVESLTESAGMGDRGKRKPTQRSAFIEFFALE